MRFSRHLLAALAIVLALVPFAGILATALLATLLGCEVNEAAPGPCLVGGADWGPLLHAMLVTGGLGHFTIPLLMSVLAVWAFVEILHRWRRQRRLARRPD